MTRENIRSKEPQTEFPLKISTNNKINKMICKIQDTFHKLKTEVIGKQSNVAWNKQNLSCVPVCCVVLSKDALIMLFKVGNENKPAQYQYLDTHYGMKKLFRVSQSYAFQTLCSILCDDKQWQIVKTADFTMQVQMLHLVMYYTFKYVT